MRDVSKPQSYPAPEWNALQTDTRFYFECNLMKTAIVLILAILAQVAGNILLSKVMSGSRDESLLQIAQNPMLWLGILFLGVFFALYTSALSWADLSFVLPATSFGYVLNVACAKYFLNEEVSPARWLGAMIICVGVAFVSRSRIKTETLKDADRGQA
jgi:drug/metabolite transporter (DMT)-like permease